MCPCTNVPRHFGSSCFRLSQVAPSVLSASANAPGHSAPQLADFECGVSGRQSLASCEECDGRSEPALGALGAPHYEGAREGQGRKEGTPGQGETRSVCAACMHRVCCPHLRKPASSASRSQQPTASPASASSRARACSAGPGAQHRIAEAFFTGASAHRVRQHLRAKLLREIPVSCVCVRTRLPHESAEGRHAPSVHARRESELGQLLTFQQEERLDPASSSPRGRTPRRLPTLSASTRAHTAHPAHEDITYHLEDRPSTDGGHEEQEDFAPNSISGGGRRGALGAASPQLLSAPHRVAQIFPSHCPAANGRRSPRSLSTRAHPRGASRPGKWLWLWRVSSTRSEWRQALRPSSSLAERTRRCTRERLLSEETARTPMRAQEFT